MAFSPTVGESGVGDLSMINVAHNPAELHLQYQQARPFPHIVIDDFFDRNIAETIADELEVVDTEQWLRDELTQQVHKCWMDDLERLPPMTAAALAYLNSTEALAFFEHLTGIPHLIADPLYKGGGVHITGPGGKLDVHADFNLHPETGFHRRVNALLYLNRDWDPAWNGELELWEPDLSAKTEIVEPILNRLAVFTITDQAFHGVPKPLACPDGRRRLSLALYYYTENRPEEEKSPHHWALWQEVSEEKPAH